MNFTFYRREGGDLTNAPDHLPFTPCGPTEQQKVGFVPVVDDKLIAQHTMRLRIERKTVPREAIEREVNRREREADRKFGRKERKQVAEQALFDLLPRAFPKTKAVPIIVWPDLIAIGSTTAADTDLVASLLVAQYPGLALSYPDSGNLGATMTGWLSDSISWPIDLFLLGQVRTARDSTQASFKTVSSLASLPEIQASLESGHRASELSLEIDGVARFVLTDALELKSVKLLGIPAEDDEGDLFLQRESLRRVYDTVTANAA